jgi:hypothetical protein
VVLPNNQQFLARRSVVARADVVHPPVGNIKTIDYGEAKWFGALGDTTTHAGPVKFCGLVSMAGKGFAPCTEYTFCSHIVV